MTKMAFNLINVLILIVIIVTVWFVYFKKSAHDVIKPSEVIQILSLIVLLFTMMYIGRQAEETARSTNLMKFNIEVQNQPYIELTDFRYIHLGGLKISGQAKCYGTTPAHDFRQTNNFFFDIDISKTKLNEYKRDSTSKDSTIREPAKIRFFFYIRKIKDAISEHIQKNPDLTMEDLRLFLDKMQKNPSQFKKTVDVDIDIKLDYEGFQVYGDIREWLNPPIVMPPGKTLTIGTGRGMGDIIPEVENGNKIIFFYCATAYEGLEEGKKLRSFYLGVLDLFHLKKEQIKVNELLYAEYPFYAVKAWSLRNKIPE